MMNISQKQILEFLQTNKELLLKRYGVTNISLFGSFARGEETEKSDIDLLYEMNDPTFSKIYDLKIYLEEAFGREVNITRKHSRLKPRFLKIISRDLINVA